MNLTEHERLELWGMRHRFEKANIEFAIGEFAQGITDYLNFGSPSHLYRALSGVELIKSVFQHVHNYAHTIAMLAAKAFLKDECPEIPWQDIEFAQHANTSGADLKLAPFHLVAELKTTEPCARPKKGGRPVGFGPQQRMNIEKDLNKLAAAHYNGFRRYMFVTSPLAFQCLLKDYRAAFPGICFVLLSANPEVSR